MERIGKYEESGISFFLYEGEDDYGDVFYEVEARADREDLSNDECTTEQWGCNSPQFEYKQEAWNWVLDELDAFYERHPDLPRPKMGKRRWTSSTE